MPLSLRLVVLFVAVFGVSTASHAAPITFTVTGTTSGQLGATPFIDAVVTVALTADTEDVISQSLDVDFDGDLDTMYAVASSLTTVSIAGLGTVNVLEPTAIYAFPPLSNVEPGEELFLLPVVVIGTLDDPPSLDSFTGLAGLASTALLGFNLATPLPATTGAGGVGRSPDIPVSTSGGNLIFNADVVESQGTLVAEVTAVPEPMTLSLFASGLVSYAGWARFRRRGRRS